MLLTVFLAQFCSVFSMVMGSKLLRDDRWQLAMLNSWLISATQFVFVLVVAHTDKPLLTFLFAASGGSLACGAAHLLYTKHIMKKD
jgi:uncharacterized membrane protein